TSVCRRRRFLLRDRSAKCGNGNAPLPRVSHERRRRAAGGNRTTKERLSMMRVLIVDDEPLARKALTQALATRADIEKLDVANDAVEALDKIEKESYDVVLLDIHMPELSGIRLAATLSKRGPGSPAIVFVTAHHEHAVA